MDLFRSHVGRAIRALEASALRHLHWIIAASALPLASCEKVQQIDALKASADSTRIQLAADEKELSQLRSNLAEMNSRVTALEAADEAKKNKKPTAPTSASLTSAQLDGLNRVIADCVAVARKAAPTPDDARWYKDFDAYYNAASGRVVNNVQMNGQVPALYAFNKCMASRGVPLS